MEEQIKKPTSFLLVVATAIVRLLPHLPNMTPVGATALFSGAKLNRPWNYLLPVALMLATDLFLGFHSTILYVYGSFLVTVWIGERGAKLTGKLGYVAGLGLLSSLIFFLITNFGVWASTPMYPKTLAGLMDSYLMGLPFWRNMLVGDVLYSVGLFGLYNWAASRHIVELVDRKILQTVQVER